MGLKHIAIILDGNRRYARKSRLRLWEGHYFGAKKVGRLVNWCRELGVKELTLYCFSVENFRRPKMEVDFLMNLFRKNFKEIEKDERIKKYGIKVNIIGRLHMFPKDMQNLMKKIMEETKNNKKYKINFAMGYGGRAEIIDAIKQIAKEVKENKISINKINDGLFSNYLYIKDEPELIIRPGGEKRVSNFLIWQGYYSEWYFTNKLWPEFTKKDLVKAIEDFKKRKRRFGR